MCYHSNSVTLVMRLFSDERDTEGADVVCLKIKYSLLAFSDLSSFLVIVCFQASPFGFYFLGFIAFIFRFINFNSTGRKGVALHLKVIQ
jgi:hypothetical protein